MAYFEAVDIADRRADVDLRVANVTCHSMADCVRKFLQFLGCTLGDEFHPAIGRIPHISGDLKAVSKLSHRVAEPDPLDVSAVTHLSSLKLHGFLSFQAAARPRQKQAKRAAGNEPAPNPAMRQMRRGGRSEYIPRRWRHPALTPAAGANTLRRLCDSALTAAAIGAFA